MSFAVQAVATNGGVTATDVNVKTIAGTPVSVNNGTADAGTLRVVVASDNTPFAVNANITNSTLAVTQSGVWTTGRTWTLSSGTDSVTVTGTVAVTQSTSPWVVSGTVTSNIGTTGGLALDTSVNGILVAQNSTTSGQTGPLIQGAVTSAAPTYNDGKTSPLSLDTSGNLRVAATVTFSTPQHVIVDSGTLTSITNPVTVAQSTAANLNATVVGTGTFAVQAAQSGTWTTGRTWTLSSGTDSVTVSGTITANQGTSPWVVSGTTVTSPANVVDTNNSSTTPLGSNATFTGTATNVLNYVRILVYIFTDQNSATDGFKFEFSQDGTNWDHIETQIITANSAYSASLPVQGQYFRIVYVNGSSAQSIFRLQTILTASNNTGDVQAIQDPFNGTLNAVVTKSSIVGKTTGGGGGYVDVKVNPSGALTADVTQATSPWIIAGNIASGSSDSGNPVKIGGVFNTTQPTVTNGQRVDSQATSRGGLIVATGVDAFNINNISGTVSLPTGAATDSSLSTINANITNGNLRGTINIKDSSGNSLTSTSSALDVNLKSSSITLNTTANLSASSTGMTRFRNTALTNTAVAVKASAGNLFYYHIYNVNTVDVYLQIYNVAQGSVTVGTTTPDLTLAIPAGGVLDGSFDSAPFSFSTAITIAATTTITGGTFGASTGLLVAMGYV